MPTPDPSTELRPPLRVGHVVDCFGAGGIAAGVLSLVQATADRVDHAIISLSDDLRLKTDLPPNATINVLKPGPTKLIGFSARLALLARRRRLDVLHCNNSFAWLDSELAAGAVGAVCLQTFHGVERPVRDLAGMNWKCRTAVRLGSVVTAVGEASRRMVCTLSGIDEAEVEIIPNGIDLNRFRPSPPDRRAGASLRSELGIPAEAGLAVHVAGLRSVKDQATLLRAWRLVVDAARRDHRPDPALLLIGEGPRRGDLEGLAANLGLARTVRFLGLRRDVDSILPCCDVFVLSSLSEGLSFAILEGMACGLPVVATHVGGNVELVEEGKTGRLTPPGDPSAMAAALSGLLSDPSTRQAMAARGRRFVERRHDVARSTDRYARLYRELVDRSPRSSSRRGTLARARCRTSV